MQKTKKSGGKAKKPKNGKLVGFSITRSIFPQRMRGIAKYATSFVANPSAGTFGDYPFRLNSIFDPDYSGVGTTVSAYTPMNALYNYYRVHNWKAKIVFTNTSTTPLTVCVYASKAVATASSFVVAISQPISWYAALDPVGGISHVTKTFQGSCAQVMGLTPETYAAASEVWAATTANPAQSPYLHIVINNQTASGATSTFFLELEFDVELTEPNARALS
jgi:hypothetical protein